MRCFRPWAPKAPRHTAAAPYKAPTRQYVVDVLLLILVVRGVRRGDVTSASGMPTLPGWEWWMSCEEM